MISTRKPDFAEPGQGLSEEEVQRSSLFCKKKLSIFCYISIILPFFATSSKMICNKCHTMCQWLVTTLGQAAGEIQPW